MYRGWKKIISQTEVCFDYIEHQKESNLERIPENYSEEFFATLFKDVSHERSIILLLPLTAPDIFKQSQYTVLEINKIESLAIEKIRRQKHYKNTWLRNYYIGVFISRKKDWSYFERRPKIFKIETRGDEIKKSNKNWEKTITKTI